MRSEGVCVCVCLWDATREGTEKRRELEPIFSFSTSVESLSPIPSDY